MSGQENDLRRAWPIWRAVTLGGVSKGELRGRLGRAGVALNEYAEALFASGLFVVSEKRYSLDIVELPLKGLGFRRGLPWARSWPGPAGWGLAYARSSLGPGCGWSTWIGLRGMRGSRPGPAKPLRGL